MNAAVVSELLLGIAVQAAFAWALAAWARYVAQKHGGFYRRVVWLPWIAFALQLAGTAFTIWMLVAAFGAAAHVDAASRATALAEGISQAMNVTAVLLVPTLLCYATSVGASLVGTVRRAAG